MLGAGGSRTDVVRLGRSNIGRDGRIRFRRQESGGEADRRFLPPLAEELVRLPHCVGLFLMTEEAMPKPFTADGFGNRVRPWCDAAGLPECSAHGLRKAGAAALACAGASEPEIAAFLDRKGRQEPATYVRAVRRARISENDFDTPTAVKGRGAASNLPTPVG
jgi:integrase